MFPVQESGPCTSSEEHRGADPPYGDIDPSYRGIYASPEFMNMGGGGCPHHLSVMCWHGLKRDDPPVTPHPSLPIADEGTNALPYQL